MKNYFIITVSLLLAIIYSCTNIDDSIQNIQTQESELVKIGQEIARIHNECLEEVYKDLMNISTRASSLDNESLEQLIITSVNKYVSQNLHTRSDNEIEEIQLFDYAITVEEVKELISEQEFNYIEAVMNNPLDIYLINKVESDEVLNYEQKKAVIGFITVFQASTEYWNANLHVWMETLNKPQTRANAGSVAFADAWWGYQALMASAMNPFVGGGMAAVASVCTAIF